MRPLSAVPIESEGDPQARPEPESVIATIPAAIADLRRGRPVVLLDEREAGQVAVAGARVRAETVAFMARHARGLVCVAVTPARAAELELKPQPGRSGRPFMVPVEARIGVTTGISAADRARTIAVISDSESVPGDLVSPGHVMPILVAEEGVRASPLAPEAAVDLAVLAGLPPTAAICQVLSDTGAPSTGEELVRFCREHRLRAVRVADLLAYRRRREEAVLRVAETTLPTRAGTFRAIGYQSVVEGGEHLAMVCGEPAGLEHVPVRIQRHCVAGEVFHSLSCRCYENLEASLSTIQAGGLGVIVHLAALHEHGRSEHAPWDAEPSCSLDLACRRQENALASRILKDLGVGSVALLCAADERPRRLAPHGIRVDKDAIPLTRTVPDRFAMGGG